MGGCASRPKDNVDGKIPEELSVETSTPSKLITNVIEVTTATEATTESSENVKKASNEAPSMDLTEPKPTETTTDASESKTDVVEMSESKIDVVEMSESKIDAVEVSKSKTDATEVDESKTNVTEINEAKIDAIEVSESKINATKSNESKINTTEVSESKIDAIERNLNVGEDNTSAKEEETKGVEKTVEATNTKNKPSES
ncbi:uncharacterized protein [Typha latifolia]|uniref:uncharacterized protein n=1 Tax=Typha latifolia TaxID=4733 RepID=UPI003C2B07D6